MKLELVEKIFESSTGFDAKNITNKSDKHVPQHMLDSIENGVTSEHAWKVCVVRKCYREFESLSLRTK